MKKRRMRRKRKLTLAALRMEYSVVALGGTNSLVTQKNAEFRAK